MAEKSTELRKRRGPAEAADSAGNGNMDAAPNKEELIDELTQMISKMKKEPKPGTSNEAKKVKDALVKDPYNMQLIYELGKAYAIDEQWDRAANVLLRGWKRVSEFDNPAVRFDFLCSLTQASLQCSKFRQALAVLNDIQEPPKDEVPKAFEVLRCQVHCSAGDLQKGLKAFNSAIEGEDFDTACTIWASCTSYLKKVGGYDVTKHTLESKAKSDEDKSKLKAMESLAELRESILNPAVDPKAKNMQRLLTVVVVVVGLLIIGFFLHKLEARSLERLKIRK